MSANTRPGGVPRRSVLSVPASEPSKIAKALASAADEVVIDLEDAVAPAEKDAARLNIAALASRRAGALAVRVNGRGTRWFHDDVAACVANPAVSSIVLPKAEGPDDIVATAEACTSQLGSRAPLLVQALIESAKGLSRVNEIAQSSERLTALIIGYADLAASLGRSPQSDWSTAQDLVQFAARAAGVQAIDGPSLLVTVDDAFLDRLAAANDRGFDGTWVIHPQQVDAATRAFTPSAEEVADAREIVKVMTDASVRGLGAVSWRGRMLDEALVVAARRTLSRVER